MRGTSLMLVCLLAGAGCPSEGDDGDTGAGSDASSGATVGTPMTAAPTGGDGPTAGGSDDTMPTTVGPTSGDDGTTAGEGATTGGGATDAADTTSGGSTDGETGREGTGDSGGSSGTTAGVTFEIQELYDRQYIHYARVEKSDRVLNLYIEAQYIDGVNDDDPLPNDTILLREDGEPATHVHIREKVAEDDWYYTQFSTDAPQYNTIPEQDSCSCHAPWEDRTITIAGLKEFKTTGSLIELVCDQPGNTPCAPKVYE